MVLLLLLLWLLVLLKLLLGTNKLRFTANVCKLDDVTYTTEQNVRNQVSSALQQKWLKTPTNHPAWMWVLSEAKASALELTQRLEDLQSAGGVSWQLLGTHWKTDSQLLSDHMIKRQRRNKNAKQWSKLTRKKQIKKTKIY